MMRSVLPFIAGLLVAWSLLARFDAPPAAPLVHADYQICATVDNGPITKEYRLPYQRKADNA